jgi:y4mF family transcriptional regulator
MNDGICSNNNSSKGGQMTIGQRIKKYREEKGMTQEQLALEIGVTQAYISQLENDKRRITLDKLDAIIQALGCKFTDILPEYKE